MRLLLLLLAALLALVVFFLTRNGERVDPNTAVPRGTNAPTEKDPEAAALAEALRKAKG